MNSATKILKQLLGELETSDTFAAQFSGIRPGGLPTTPLIWPTDSHPETQIQQTKGSAAAQAPFVIPTTQPGAPIVAPKTTPGMVSDVRVITKSVTSDGVLRKQVTVQFTHPPNDLYFTGANIYLHPKNGQPALVASGSKSPLTFTTDLSSISHVVRVTSVGNWGETDVLKSPSAKVSLVQTVSSGAESPITAATASQVGTPPSPVTAFTASVTNTTTLNGLTAVSITATFTPGPVNTSTPALNELEIYAEGYQGNSEPMLVGKGGTSPLIFDMDLTGETVTLYAVPVAKSGATAGITVTTPSVSITLSAPVPPSALSAFIASGNSTGVSIEMTPPAQAAGNTIHSIWVWRNTVNTFSTASVVDKIPIGTGSTSSDAYLFSQVVDYGDSFWYWATVVDTQGNQSTATAFGELTSDSHLSDGQVVELIQTGQSFSITNPNFVNGTVGWTGSTSSSATIAQSSDSPFTNGKSLEITASALGNFVESEAQYKVAPGDIIYFSAYLLSDGTFEILGQISVHDGSGNVLVDSPQIGFTTSTSWAQYTASAVMPANAAYCVIEFIRGDSSGGSHSAWVTDVQVQCSSAVAPNSASTLLNGQATLVGNPAATISYTSTTSSIDWSWSAFSMYFPDGSAVSVASGSQNFTGLTSSTTYYFEFYVTKSTGVMSCVLSDQSSGTAPASVEFQVQTVGADGHAIEVLDLTAATTSGGSGGGSGGGGTCFSGDTQIETDRGFIRMDCLPSEFTVVNKTGSHRAQLIVHRSSTAPMRVMPDGTLVTEEHLFQREDGAWVPARELFIEKAAAAARTVYNVHVITDNPDDAHYLLKNGFVAHNKKRSCFSGDAQVRTSRGFMRMDELPEIFLVVNKDGVFPARLVRHQNCSVCFHKKREQMQTLPGGSLATANHLLRKPGDASWTEAGKITPSSAANPRTLYNIHIDGSDFFELADGFEAHHMRGA